MDRNWQSGEEASRRAGAVHRLRRYCNVSRSKPSRTSQRASATVCVSSRWAARLPVMPDTRRRCRRRCGQGCRGGFLAGGPGVFVPGVVLDLAEGGAGVPRSSGCRPSQTPPPPQPGTAPAVPGASRGTNGSTPSDERGSMARDYCRPAAAARALVAACGDHYLLAVSRRRPPGTPGFSTRWRAVPGTRRRKRRASKTN